MTVREFDVLNYINQHEIGRTDKISCDLQISESTVRRALDRLEQRGLIRRFHGGATVIKNKEQTKVNARFEKYPQAKTEIARAAAEMVKEGNTIILLGGTTVANMCKFLQRRRLTVITNSMLVWQMLRENFGTKLILLGGEYSREEDELQGFLTSSTLQQLGADWLFSGASAFSERRGFLTDHINSVELYNNCFQSAKRVVMLADSSKYSKSGLAVTASCEKVDCLITDNGLPKAALGKFEEASVQVILV